MVDRGSCWRSASWRSIQSGSSPGRGVEISNSCGPRWPKRRLKVARSISPRASRSRPSSSPRLASWPGRRAEPGGQRVGRGVADQPLQPLPGGDERRAAGPGGRRQHPADPVELRVQRVAHRSASSRPVVDRGDLGPPAVAALRVVGEIAIEQPGVAPGLAGARAAPSGAIAAQHGQPRHRDRRDLQVGRAAGRTPPRSAAGTASRCTPTAGDSAAITLTFEIDPAADPAVAEIGRDGRGGHRVGQEDLDHRPGRRASSRRGWPRRHWCWSTGSRRTRLSFHGIRADGRRAW